MPYFTLIMKKSRFIVLLVALGCNIPHEDSRLVFTEKQLPTPIQLKGEKLDFGLEFALNPKEILLKDQNLIVAEGKSLQNEKVHLLDLRGQKYRRSVGKDGLGPGEITIGYPLLDSGEPDIFWVYDTQQFKFSAFSIKDTSSLAIRQFKGLDIPLYITSVDWGPNNTLLVNLVDGWVKYFQLNTDGDTIRYFGSWENMLDGRELPQGVKREDLQPNLLASLHQGKIKSNPSKTRFVKAGTHVDFIDIIDIENEEVITVYGPIDELPEFRVSMNQGFQMPAFDLSKLTLKYLDIYAGDKSFFALYSGKSFREISEDSNLNRLFEFDYDGKVLNHYQLDFPLIGFTVDEINRKIYGISTDMDPGIVLFDLN
ncbi:TolB-like protein [Cecembia calidifontis]|uniref:TolB-like protein n=2 Tax=Cecembia calidifontis TaxID=1187080 RepID=A0A4V2F619_9BACT|nr:TolB-like protein [Cecembia calidifontis]